MNLLIKELAEQAGIFKPEQFRQHIDALQLEKFAELIVRECLLMCDETQAVYYKHRQASLNFTDKNRYAAGETAADTIYTKIKLHFGVEL